MFHPEHHSIIETRSTINATGAALDARFLRTLSEDTRDVSGRLLLVGSPVISRPEMPNEVCADTPANRQAFIKGGYAWTNGTRQVAWLPDVSTWHPLLRESFAAAKTRCQSFSDAIHENLRAAKGTTAPHQQLPLYSYLVPFTQNIRSVQPVADLTDTLNLAMCRVGGLPANVTLPESWQAELSQSNRMMVHSVRCGIGEFHVVQAFVHPLAFSVTDVVKPIPVSARYAALVQEVYDDYQANSPKMNHADPASVFFTIGSTSPWPVDALETGRGLRSVLLSSQDEELRWHSQPSQQYVPHHYLDEFFYRLHPETERLRARRVQQVIDGYIADGYEGSILLKHLAHRTGYAPAIIRRAAHTLQATGEYECYRQADAWAIRKSTGNPGRGLRSPSSRFVSYHLGVWGGFLAGSLLAALLEWPILLTSIPCGYFGRCVEKAVQKLGSKDPYL